MEHGKQLFTRKYNDLHFLITNGTDYDLLKASGILRQFLIDPNSVIDTINREYKRKVEFKIDKSFDNHFIDDSRLLFHSSKIDGGDIVFSAKSKNVTKSEFLKSPILKNLQNSFMVIEIIKFLANKKGGVHLDIVDSKNDLEQINLKILLRTLKEIGLIVLEAFLPLKEAIVKKPDNLPILGHYKSNIGFHYNFNGINQFLSNGKINSNIQNGFSIFMELNIQSQPKVGKRVIFEIGGNPLCFNFKITINREGNLECNAKLSSNRILKVNYPNYNSHLNTWTSVYSKISFDCNMFTLELRLNKHLVSKISGKYKTKNSMLSEMSLGSNLKGKQNSAIKLSEMIILIDSIDEKTEIELLNYFEGNWKK